MNFESIILLLIGFISLFLILHINCNFRYYFLSNKQLTLNNKNKKKNFLKAEIISSNFLFLFLFFFFLFFLIILSKIYVF